MSTSRSELSALVCAVASAPGPLSLPAVTSRDDDAVARASEYR
ncbi:Uncharacterised protein [Mycobacteroides abscessus subsp. abscessus]|nr:Uncharacterised protein [Mycobacteroides abscessus subsp. abscessus]